MTWVYIVRCADGTFYVGHTNDVAWREQIHNHGFGSSYTAKRRPVTLAYSEEHVSLESAAKRERQLKRWSARKKEALIAGDVRKLKALSKRRTSKTGDESCS